MGDEGVSAKRLRWTKVVPTTIRDDTKRFLTMNEAEADIQIDGRELSRWFVIYLRWLWILSILSLASFLLSETALSHSYSVFLTVMVVAPIVAIVEHQQTK